VWIRAATVALALSAVLVIGRHFDFDGVALASRWREFLAPLLYVATVLALLALVQHTRAALQRSQARYHDLIDYSPDGIAVLNAAGYIERVNPQLVNLSGYCAEELLGRSVEILVPSRFSHHAQMVKAYLQEPTTRYMGIGRGLTLRHRDGDEIPVEISLAPLFWRGERTVAAAIRDVSAKQRAERAVQDSERRLRGITDAIPGAVYQFERSGDGRQRFKFMSHGITALLEQGDDAPPVTLESFSACVVPEDLPALMASIELASRTAAAWTHEFRIRTRRGNLKWVRASSLPSPSAADGSIEWNGILVDFTEVRSLAEQLSHQAEHDGLTGLLNRRAFEQRLAETLEALHGEQGEMVLAYLDLDQFKVVNDTCGHGAGDELLRQLAAMLKDSLRERDVLARLGGDEFAIIMNTGGIERAHAVMQRVREAIADFRFQWQDKLFNVGVSIGLVAAHARLDLGEVLRRADAACYAAKDAGRNCIHVFRDEDVALASQHGQMRWVPLINDAIIEDRFELHAQRIIGLKDTTAHERHYEILLRMRLPSGELAPPGAFLPAAERYNLAPRLDRWVVGRLCDWLEQSGTGAAAGVTFNINLSGLSIGDADTTGFIIEQLRTRNIVPGCICFEITETAAISKLSLARAFIAELKSLGCRFALDDFGSGISSFGQLKNLDIDLVKIDGMFVRDIAHDKVDLAMVTAINEMAHALGMLTVAEFVEDDAVLAILKRIGVDYAQGYGIGRPLPLTASVMNEALEAREAMILALDFKARAVAG
jgi:diguanylate cyclase (GGDEF)-like protein/PAS domain S-box-containing protein